MRITGGARTSWALRKEVKGFLLFILYLVLPVLSAAQTVTVQRDLDFDLTQAGAPVTVQPGEARSAYFLVSGTPGNEVQITFELPADLADDSGNSLPVAFGPESAGYSRTDDPNSVLLFDPEGGLITGLSATGSLYIWLGGAIRPEMSQRGGNYRTDITLNASYTTE